MAVFFIDHSATENMETFHH